MGGTAGRQGFRRVDADLRARGTDHSIETVADLASAPLIVVGEGASIRAAMDEAFERAGREPRVAFECADPRSSTWPAGR